MQGLPVVQARRRWIVTALCWLLAVLFAWCAISAGHVTYRYAPAPTAVSAP